MSPQLFIYATMIGLYFTPTFIAKSRGVKNLAQIFQVNLLLGWSIIGWFLALYWALKPIS